VEDFSKPQYFPERLKQLNSKKPKNIFMDSMSDVADWGHSISRSVELKMMSNPQHNYLFLTKRPCTATMFLMPRNPREKIWIGVSVTTAQQTGLIDELYNAEDFHRHQFVSIEPLLEDITATGLANFLDCEWIIIGAETGNRKGKIIPKKEWVDKIVSIAKEDGIPVFMKESLLKIMSEENMLRELPKSLKGE